MPVNKPFPSPPVPEGAVRHDELTAKVKEIRTVVYPILNNPYFVVNEDLKPIGSAVLDFVAGGEVGGVTAQIFLEQASPERFDFEVNPGDMRVVLDLIVRDNIVSGRVIVKRWK